MHALRGEAGAFSQGSHIKPGTKNLRIQYPENFPTNPLKTNTSTDGCNKPILF